MVADAASVRNELPSGNSSQHRSRRSIGAAGYGYGLAALATILGWIVTREYQLFDPLYGAGYWIGIVGASLMGLLLLYPIRKRVALFRHLGPTKVWFQIHIIFGLVGPILILYHANFRFGSLNSNVALACTLLVAASGLIGRYLHAKIYADLEGHKRTLKDLSDRARLTPEQKARATTLAPHLLENMTAFDRYVLAPPVGFMSSLLLPARLAVLTRIGYLRLAWSARREIRKQAKKAGISRSRRRKAEAALCDLIGTHLRRVRRVAEFHSYERLFSLWHVFHLPFFYILIVTALLHVAAVHMY